MNFSKQTVWVTGGGSGIGAAVAQGFAAAGAAVVISDIDRQHGEEIANGIRDAGGIADALALDVTDYSALESTAGFIAKQHGGIDHVVACAGISSRHTINQMAPETWRRVIDVNLTGAFLVTKAARAAMAERGGGSVAVISSVAAEHVAYLSGVHYAASKTALVGFVRHAAFELGAKNIRVNAVGPGPMSNRMGGGRFPEDRLKAMAQNLPLQRVVEPEDVANTCLLLASPLAKAITGVYLPVDGGFLTSRNAPYRAYFEAHEEAF